LAAVQTLRAAASRGLGLLRVTSTQPIIRNAASLFGSTIITSLLGFVFWLVAARLLSPTDVGVASAVLSASQLIAYVCIFGLGTLTIAELAESRVDARRLLGATTIATGVAGLAAGFGLGILLALASAGLRPALEGSLRLAIFALLCGGTTVGVLLDDACVGLLRGDIQLRRNAIFAATKLAMLPILAVAWKAAGGTEVIVAWLAGVVLSLGLVRGPLRRATPDGPWRPDFRRLVEKRRLIYAHHWLNISIIAPGQLLPLLVAGIISPAANAAFYAAMLVVGFVKTIPSSLSTALFALKPGDEVALREEARRTMKLCLVLAIGSGAFFLGCSRLVLEVFRHSYTSAAPAMALLGLTTFPSSVKVHYVAIARVQLRMRQAAFASTVGALIEVGAAAAGAELMGITGVALGLLIASVIEVFLFGPTVLRALRWPLGATEPRTTL
jgi:O-antigen/teichoic acid export membrane protein